MPNNRNSAGAIIYADINKHEVLDVPKVATTSEVGKAYHVLSVGVHRTGVGMVTVKENGKAIAYRLPEGKLQDWAFYSIGLAQQGIKLFPCDIEFGELPTGYYAEIL